MTNRSGSTTVRGQSNSGVSASSPYPLGQRSGPGVARVAARLTGLEARMAKMEMGARANQISFSSMIGGDLSVVDLEGELLMKIGTHSDGKQGVSYHSGTAPPQPTVPLCSAREGYIVVGWDGEFVDGAGKPTDFARVDVHVSTDPGFTPNPTTAVTSMLSESVTLVPGGIDNYYVRLVAVSNADVPSTATEAVMSRPLPLSHFAAGSIAAIHLAAQLVLSTTIVAGDPNGAHLEMNPSGLQMVRSTGVPTVTFSADEGNAIITGTIQTAPPGQGMARIVFNPFPGQNYNAIRFYSPDGTSWSTMAAAYDQGGTPGGLLISGPISSSSRYLSGMLTGRTSSSLIMIDTNDPDATATQGLYIGGDAQQLYGSGISFLFSYGAEAGGNYTYPTMGFIDTVKSGTPHVTSLFSYREVILNGSNCFSMGSSYQQACLTFGGQSLTAHAYSPSSQLINIYALNTSSGKAVKTDIVSMDDVFATEVAETPLQALRHVETKRFRRKNDVPDELEIDLPLSPAELSVRETDDEPSVRVESVEPNKHITGDEYGFIAEDIREVAPEAVMYDPEGRLHLNALSLCAVLWSAVQELDTKVSQLTERRDGRPE